MKDQLKAWEDINRLWSKCYDCEMEYKNFQDFQIPDELWERIKPTVFDGVGLLCPTCCLNRLRELGITLLPITKKNLKFREELK